MQTLDTICILAYMAGMIAFGAFVRRQEDTSDFFVAQRRMPWLVVSISIVASAFSAITFVALPGEAIAHGLTLSLGVVITPIAVLFVAFFMLKHFYGLRSYSAHEYLEQRFNVSVRCAVAGIFLLSRLMYLGTVLYASAKAFAPSLEWRLDTIIIAVGTVSIVYTALGGIRAVLWTDAVQYGVILLGVGAIVVTLVRDVPGGVSGIFDYAGAHGRTWQAYSSTEFYRLDIFSADFYRVRLNFWVIIAVALLSQVSNTGADQTALQRTFSARSLKECQKAMAWNVVWLSLLVALLWFIGIGLFAYYGHFPERLGTETKPDETLMFFVVHSLPAGVSGFILAAVLAAVMSTMDSSIHTLSTVTIADFTRRLGRRNRSEADDLKLARTLTVVWGAIAIGMALLIANLSERHGATLVEVVQVWLSTSQILLAIFLLGIFTRSATSVGVLLGAGAGLLVWAVIVFGFYYGQPEDERVSFLWASVGACLGTLVFGYAASSVHNKITGPSDPQSPAPPPIDPTGTSASDA